MLSITCFAGHAISDCHVIIVHVYNRSNLITRISVVYHYNKQALHIGPNTLYTNRLLHGLHFDMGFINE